MGVKHKRRQLKDSLNKAYGRIDTYAHKRLFFSNLSTRLGMTVDESKEVWNTIVDTMIYYLLKHQYLFLPGLGEMYLDVKVGYDNGWMLVPHHAYGIRINRALKWSDAKLEPMVVFSKKFREIINSRGLTEREKVKFKNQMRKVQKEMEELGLDEYNKNLHLIEKLMKENEELKHKNSKLSKNLKFIENYEKRHFGNNNEEQETEPVTQEEQEQEPKEEEKEVNKE